MIQSVSNLQQNIEFRDQFISTMSHELRTPLHAILGICEVMSEEVYGPVTPKQQSMLETVGESGLHLLSLINQVLDVSKMSAAEEELELGPLNLQNLCEQAMTIARSLVTDDRTSLSLHYRSTRAKVVGDARRLRQVLLNLLGNAVKFTEEGRIQVIVEDRGPRIEIAVRDDGIGIAPEHVQRLFEPFFQVDGELARKHTGTGLGLTLSQRIVQMHGGMLTAESAPGAGSTFSFSIPVDGPAVPQPRSARPEPETGQPH